MSDERSQIGIVHAGFAMAALPHKKTTESVWQRQGGQITLLVESGLDSSKRPIGVPYGSIARMIVLYLQTQAVKTRSREVELGGSMNAWLNTDGHYRWGQDISARPRTIAADQSLSTDFLSKNFQTPNW